MKKLYNGVLLKEVLEPVEQSDPRELSNSQKSTENSRNQTKKTKPLSPAPKRKINCVCYINNSKYIIV